MYRCVKNVFLLLFFFMKLSSILCFGSETYFLVSSCKIKLWSELGHAGVCRTNKERNRSFPFRRFNIFSLAREAGNRVRDFIDGGITCFMIFLFIRSNFHIFSGLRPCTDGQLFHRYKSPYRLLTRSRFTWTGPPAAQKHRPTLAAFFYFLTPSLLTI